VPSSQETGISTEIELKLAVRAADLPALRRALSAMAKGEKTARAKLVSTYYDTADRALAQRGCVLRVRHHNGHFIQTVKSDGIRGASALARGEWEDAIAGQRPDPQARESGRFLTSDVADRLEPIFQTVVTRAATELSPQPGTTIEVAIDRGEIHAPGGQPVEQISEIELELKDGSVSALYDAALQLLAAAPLRLERRSKAERGYNLAAGDSTGTASVHSRPFDLDPGTSTEEALQRIGRACLDQALRNESAILAGRPEGVHQMRVAVRRLRATLSAFRSILPEEQRRAAADELRWLAQVLGEARNIDVFSHSLLGPARDALPQAKRLDAPLRRRRRAAYATIQRILRSPRYTALMLGLLRRFDSRGWGDTISPDGDDLGEELRRPIGETAPLVLDKRLRAVRKASKDLAEQSPEERHELRIALKKLRYASELLSGLYEPTDVRKFTNWLKRLQDELGDVNDLRVGYDIVAELSVNSRSRPAIERAGRQLLEWHEARLAKHEPKIRRHLQQLLDVEPFWRA
jgi:inorganic triphosphatase YgiF